MARGTGSVSRALGAAALGALALLGLRYLSVGLLAGLGADLGALCAAAALAAAGYWLAPALGRRLGGDPRGAPKRPWLPGLGAGSAAAATVALLLLVSSAARYRGFPAAPWPAFLLGSTLAAALGYAEETFIRGAAFGVLEYRAGTRTAIWGGAVLLAVVGLISGMGVVTALTTLALGLWWGERRARTGSPSFAAAAHAGWNVLLGPVLGLGGEVAGGLGRSLFVAHVGAPWWAGPPGAVLGGLAALAVVCVLAVWPHVGRRPAAHPAL